MTGSWWVPLVSVAGLGVVAYGVKRYIDRRIEMAVGGRIEVLRRLEVGRFEAQAHIRGMLAEVDHAVQHVRRGDGAYAEACREWSMRARQEARSRIIFVGDEYVDQVTRATDAALQFAEAGHAGSYDDWEALYAATASLWML